jgi:hypothetical protein
MVKFIRKTNIFGQALWLKSNTSYSGGKDLEDRGPRPLQAKFT